MQGMRDFEKVNVLQDEELMSGGWCPALPVKLPSTPDTASDLLHTLPPSIKCDNFKSLQPLDPSARWARIRLTYMMLPWCVRMVKKGCDWLYLSMSCTTVTYYTIHRKECYNNVNGQIWMPLNCLHISVSVHLLWGPRPFQKCPHCLMLR